MELFAYVGEDELGSGEVGLKQVLVRTVLLPLVAVKREKIDTPELISGLGEQAARYGKTIRLVRFVEVETLRELAPTPGGVK